MTDEGCDIGGLIPGNETKPESTVDMIFLDHDLLRPSSLIKRSNPWSFSIHCTELVHIRASSVYAGSQPRLRLSQRALAGLRLLSSSRHARDPLPVDKD
jgi:hypothetical protein